MSEEHQSNYRSTGLWEVLPNINCNLQQELIEGSTSKGILMIIFPNAESIMSWFSSFSGNSLRKLGILNLSNIKVTEGLSNIPSPIGLGGLMKSGSRNK